MKSKLKSPYYRLRFFLGVGAMLLTTLVFAGAAQFAVRQVPSSQNWDTANVKRLLHYHFQVSRMVPLLQPSPYQVDMRQLLIGDPPVQSDKLEER